MNEGWVVFKEDSDTPVLVSKDIGSYVPVWTEPISAHQWANSFSTKISYYVREVSLLNGEKRE